MSRNKAAKFYYNARKKKEEAGNFSRVIAAYATPSVADESSMRLEEYWDEIIRICYLEEKNPAQKWKELMNQM